MAHTSKYLLIHKFSKEFLRVHLIKRKYEIIFHMISQMITYRYHHDLSDLFIMVENYVPVPDKMQTVLPTYDRPQFEIGVFLKLAWQICLILLKCLILTLHTRNKVSKIPNDKLRFIKINWKIKIKLKRNWDTFKLDRIWQIKLIQEIRQEIQAK